MPEKQFGPYRLVHQIAVGGMAEIHLAKTKGIAGFEKFVALKMIHPNFSQDQQFIEMLIDEAKLTVQLQHVNIAQTFDLGRVDQTYYITMEFVDGADLYKLLRRGSEKEVDVPAEVAAFVAKEVSNGLDYAHRKRNLQGASLGIVHRDVSPQNVLISYSGEVKLVDFGIAKATMRARQTAVGVIKGKYYYMSPEQAWGEKLDRRTDIFSTGILLYEMLTGQMLYLEEDLHKLLEMVRAANIASPKTLRPDVPPQLERIVMRALARDREDRYATAADLASDLERFLHAYAPVFTPAKVVAWMDQVVERKALDVAPVAQVAPVDPVDHKRQTKQLTRDELFLDGSEFTDENSVIFKVADLEKARRAAEMREGSQDAIATVDSELEEPPTISRPDAAVARERPADNDGLTRQLRGNTPSPFDELDDFQDQTVVSGPPQMDGRRLAAAARHQPFRGINEPTAVATDRPFDVLDGDPTIPGDDDRTVPEHERSLEGIELDATEMTGTELTEVEDSPPTRPGRPAERRGWQAAPALAAANPKPAVSSIRQPRQSRRTPPEGNPMPTGSVLSSLLSGTPSGRGPRVAMSGPATSSTPVQSHSRDRASATGSAGTSPPADPVAASRPRQSSPSGSRDVVLPPQPAPPRLGPPPPELASPQLPSPAQVVGFPGMNPALMNTSAQFAAVELDDIPDRYKLGRGGISKTTWLWAAGIGAAVTLIAVLALTVGGTGEVASGAGAKIEVVSSPPGGTVYVDEKQLDGETPAVFRDARQGRSYLIAVELPHHTRWEAETLVPEGMDSIKVIATLERVKVRLIVESSPLDAEVFLNGKSYGRTPLSIDELDPQTATELVIKKRNFLPIKRRLDWSTDTEKSLSFSLKK